MSGFSPPSIGEGEGEGEGEISIKYLNHALTKYYLKNKKSAALAPINHLIYNGDISLALHTFYQTLSDSQRTVFQQAVAEVILLFEVSNTAIEVYLDLFDLVDQGQMHHCLSAIALKLGNTLLAQPTEHFEDEEDNVFYFGLTAITSMAGTGVDAQEYVTDALLTLVDSPNFQRTRQISKRPGGRQAYQIKCHCRAECRLRLFNPVAAGT